MKLNYELEAIYTGMQSGVDSGIARAAYDLHIPVKGYVPKGYRMLNPEGKEDTNRFALNKYDCIETNSRDWTIRTELNIIHTDATLWLGNTESRGFQATIRFCRKHDKQIIINPQPKEFIEWLEKLEIKNLNGAGNRASKDNIEFYKAYNFIQDAFRPKSITVSI